MNTGREGDALLTRGLDELDAIRRRVINVVGHALRTPVTTMVGMATALQATDDDATRATLVEGLVRNAGRVEQLLDDLLIAAGVSTAYPIGDTASRSVRDTFETEWRSLEGPNQLTFSGPELSVVVSAGIFERITHTVLDNALKYGGGQIVVTTSAMPSGVRVEVESVGDIPSEEEVANAFELFYRGEHAVTATLGLGIGLPVARELARAEGGEVGLERRGAAIVTSVELPA